MFKHKTIHGISFSFCVRPSQYKSRKATQRKATFSTLLDSEALLLADWRKPASLKGTFFVLSTPPCPHSKLMLALAVRLAAEALNEKHILAEYQVIESLTRHKRLCAPILKAVQSWIGLRQQRRHLSKGLSFICGVVSTSDCGPLLSLTSLFPSIFAGLPVHPNKFAKQAIIDMRERSFLIHVCVCSNQIIAHFTGLCCGRNVKMI